MAAVLETGGNWESDRPTAEPKIEVFSDVAFQKECDRRDDFKWLEEAEAKGELRQYRGHKVAVLNQSVVGFGDNGLLLRNAICEKYQVPPHRPVISYVYGEMD